MFGVSRMMGIKLCPAPQISEHCPIKILERLGFIKIWLMRPGIASIFNPDEGMAQEWITSLDVISNRVDKFWGIIKCVEVDKIRDFLELEIREFNFSVNRFMYSYAQCHWNPVTLILMIGFKFSSIKYSVFIDGMAMKINIRAGRVVQNISISCASKNIWL